MEPKGGGMLNLLSGSSVFSLLTAASVFIADQRCKNIIEEDEKKLSAKIFNKKIIIKRTHNYGLPMNRLDTHKGLVIGLTSIIFAIVMVFYAVTLGSKGRFLLKAGLGLLAGGAASNVYDRWKREYVVDYFSFSFLKKVVFNIGDICIMAGSLLIMITELKNV